MRAKPKPTTLGLLAIAVVILGGIFVYGYFQQYYDAPLPQNQKHNTLPNPNPTPTPEPTPKPEPVNAGGTSPFGILTGRVTISPTCPVERIPPDPGCAPAPYATTISISNASGFMKAINSDANGNFQAVLLPGTYTLIAGAGRTLPRCPDTYAAVEGNRTTNIAISCDSGIR